MNVHWGLLVVLYLFLAGMAGGIYFTASFYDFFTGHRTNISKKGYTISFVLLLVAVFLLILDLERPSRFVHMMLAYKFFSPMSVGSWGLLFFGLNSFITVCINSEGALKPLGDFFLRIAPFRVYGLVGVALSVFLSTYTGVLLSETTRTLWSATPFLGALFLASGISCGVCLLLLIEKEDEVFLKQGKRFDNICLVVELSVIFFYILALTIGYGPYAETSKLFTGLYGLLFIGGGILIGTVIPILMNIAGMKGKVVPVLVLVGAFLLRYAIVYAGQQ